MFVLLFFVTLQAVYSDLLPLRDLLDLVMHVVLMDQCSVYKQWYKQLKPLVFTRVLHTFALFFFFFFFFFCFFFGFLFCGFFFFFFGVFFFVFFFFCVLFFSFL